jgi:hypothetical protein
MKGPTDDLASESVRPVREVLDELGVCRPSRAVTKRGSLAILCMLLGRNPPGLRYHVGPGPESAWTGAAGRSEAEEDAELETATGQAPSLSAGLVPVGFQPTNQIPG